MATEHRLVRSEQTLAAVVDDDTVMFSPEQGVYFGLDPVGGRVWELLERPHTLDELCAILRDEYDVDAETCRTDVAALIAELREAGLVRDAP
jgi:PqqD family protein of HPr-rel-A system